MFGNVMVVNGKAWPFLNVEPRKYRFRLLNGCDSRFLTIQLSNGRAFQQIGSDGAYLARPVSRTTLTVAPGERADIVVNFAGLPVGSQTVLMNSAATPFPTGTAPKPGPRRPDHGLQRRAAHRSGHQRGAESALHRQPR